MRTIVNYSTNQTNKKKYVLRLKYLKNIKIENSYPEYCTL